MICILWLVKTTVKTAASCDSFPQRCRCQAVPVAPKGRRDHKALEPCPAKGATTLLPNGQAICPQPPSPMGHPEPKLLGLWIPGLPHIMKVHSDGNDDGKFTIYIYQMVQTPEFWTINYVWLDTLAIPSAASHTNYDIRPRPVRPNKKVRLPDLDPSCCHVAFCTKIPGSRSDALAAFWSFGWRCVFQENQQMGGLGTGLVELEQKG